jgi:hypothetical protein
MKRVRFKRVKSKPVCDKAVLRHQVVQYDVYLASTRTDYVVTLQLFTNGRRTNRVVGVRDGSGLSLPRESAEYVEALGVVDAQRRECSVTDALNALAVRLLRCSK